MTKAKGNEKAKTDSKGKNTTAAAETSAGPGPSDSASEFKGDPLETGKDLGPSAETENQDQLDNKNEQSASDDLVNQNLKEPLPEMNHDVVNIARYPIEDYPEVKKYVDYETRQRRVDLDGLTQLTEKLLPVITGFTGGGHQKNSNSREISLAITKLQEAKMWLGDYLKNLGAANPYPESKNHNSQKIEKTADVASAERSVEYLQPEEWNNLSHTSRVKWLRAEMDSQIGKLNMMRSFADQESKGALTFNEEMNIAFLQTYCYLREATHWLGQELGRIHREASGGK